MSFTQAECDEPRAWPGAGPAVLTVLPHEITRRGIGSLLDGLSRRPATEACASPGEAVDRLRTESFDLLIVSAAYGEPQLTELVERATPYGVKVLLLLESAEPGLIPWIATIPFDGYLIQEDLTAESIAEALSRLDRGKLPIPDALARLFISQAGRTRGGHRGLRVQLTPRERAVLGLIAEGLSNRMIAHRFGISEHGVKRHVANLLAKFNCANRAQVVSVALQQGLLA
ncbi:response regulator transcription factor [Winogradskya humida]|uniref:DNA-binding response regulator n=1 Tax=Winogradskya humida TaxID=113566 RepID=A0ABQ3ZWQ4_9ACTN|nr:response regulator transcription factor [Actinoplanes humidus]GIE23042.1 DNA-binding response regulator [Actinoplanes humidus]